jgi:ribonuclease D
VALVAAWVAQLGRDLRIDPSLLATRGDLAAFLNGDPDARLASGWRATLIGEPVRRLVEGRAALAFGRDGAGTRGGLVLEERSDRPVVVDLPVPHAPWTRG